MRLTSFTDFGLRALMRMASEPDRAFSTADLAEEFALSRHHLTKIIAALSQMVSLSPGDLIFTGTPAGVGPLNRGDTCKVEIEGLQSASVTIA